jgi:hypothetical protein
MRRVVCACMRFKSLNPTDRRGTSDVWQRKAHPAFQFSVWSQLWSGFSPPCPLPAAVAHCRTVTHPADTQLTPSRDPAETSRMRLAVYNLIFFFMRRNNAEISVVCGGSPHRPPVRAEFSAPAPNGARRSQIFFSETFIFSIYASPSSC